MFGIPGSDYLASRVIESGSLGAFEEVTSLLGLNAGNAPVLLSLGDVQFSLNTATFRQLNHNSEAVWAQTGCIGSTDRLHYTGPGDETLTLPGELYPQWRGSARLLDTLRLMMRSGEVYCLLSASGDILGVYVIQSVSQESSLFKSDGTPRKISFTLTLRRYAELAHQKETTKEKRGFLGGVKTFIGKIENKVGSALGTVEGAIGSVTSEITEATNKATDSVLDPISKELGL
ncbi:phage tail protein [Acetobacteraceae bacterium ESL0709]|nr:phage tail protein [Acetobacteraceae bacterium ESL0697]MDF7677372.1 phage tail protein [Acetobacteraceae bacterium ESL0709]